MFGFFSSKRGKRGEDGCVLYQQTGPITKAHKLKLVLGRSYFMQVSSCTCSKTLAEERKDVDVDKAMIRPFLSSC